MIKENKNQLIIISLVAIMAIVLLAVGNKTPLQGAVVDQIRHVETFEPQCVDDDPDEIYNQFGMVQLRSTQYLDYCRGSTLIQRYCRTGGKIGIADYPCPNGCREGVCL
ncbi:hypothetical protein J4479_04745 [Candidatus Woesearchaeota archaeon]|nr:hypothetical protein [Candidatus Woesearchaeota archaeon]